MPRLAYKPDTWDWKPGRLSSRGRQIAGGMVFGLPLWKPHSRKIRDVTGKWDFDLDNGSPIVKMSGFGEGVFLETTAGADRFRTARTFPAAAMTRGSFMLRFRFTGGDRVWGLHDGFECRYSNGNFAHQVHALQDVVAAPVSLNTWYTVVGTWRVSGGTSNGQLFLSDGRKLTGSLSAATVTNDRLSFLTRLTLASGINGQFGQFVMWQRVLSDSEARYLTLVDHFVWARQDTTTTVVLVSSFGAPVGAQTFNHSETTGLGVGVTGATILSRNHSEIVGFGAGAIETSTLLGVDRRTIGLGVGTTASEAQTIIESVSTGLGFEVVRRVQHDSPNKTVVAQYRRVAGGRGGLSFTIAGPLKNLVTTVSHDHSEETGLGVNAEVASAFTMVESVNVGLGVGTESAQTDFVGDSVEVGVGIDTMSMSSVQGPSHRGVRILRGAGPWQAVIFLPVGEADAAFSEEQSREVGLGVGVTSAHTFLKANSVSQGVGIGVSATARITATESRETGTAIAVDVTEFDSHAVGVGVDVTVRDTLVAVPENVETGIGIGVVPLTGDKAAVTSGFGIGTEELNTQIMIESVFVGLGIDAPSQITEQAFESVVTGFGAGTVSVEALTLSESVNVGVGIGTRIRVGDFDSVSLGIGVDVTPASLFVMFGRAAVGFGVGSVGEDTRALAGSVETGFGIDVDQTALLPGEEMVRLGFGIGLSARAIAVLVQSRSTGFGPNVLTVTVFSGVERRVTGVGPGVTVATTQQMINTENLGVGMAVQTGPVFVAGDRQWDADVRDATWHADKRDDVFVSKV